MHPAKVQLRGFDEKEVEGMLKAVDAEIVKVKDGIDLYFADVNDARLFISKLKRLFSLKVKMSTENLGFKARGRYLFVYSVRRER